MWSTVIRSYVVALRVRRLTFEAGALFAGRMPMTSVYIGGGVTYDGTENFTAGANSRMTMFENLAKEIGLFVIQEYVPIALALGLLYPDYDNVHNGPANGLATGTGKGYGGGLGRYLSWGAFPNPDTDAPRSPGWHEGPRHPGQRLHGHQQGRRLSVFLTRRHQVAFRRI